MLRSNTALIVFLFVVSWIYLTFSSLQGLVPGSMPEEADRFARQYIQVLQNGDTELATELMHPDSVDESTRDGLGALVALLGDDEPLSFELANSAYIKAPFANKQTSKLTYEIMTTNGRVLANVVVDKYKGKLLVRGTYMQPLPLPLKEVNALVLKGKSRRHYTMMLAAIAVPGFVIFTIVVCLASRIEKKWFWVFISLFGLGSINFNWAFERFTFNVMPISSVWAPGLREGLFGSPVISFAIPLGAIIFHLKFKKLKERTTAGVEGGGEGEGGVAG